MQQTCLLHPESGQSEASVCRSFRILEVKTSPGSSLSLDSTCASFKPSREILPNEGAAMTRACHYCRDPTERHCFGLYSIRVGRLDFLVVVLSCIGAHSERYHCGTNVSWTETDAAQRIENARSATFPILHAIGPASG